MILEFTGAPASGKTTIVKNISENKYNLSYKYKENFFGKIIFHLFLLFPHFIKEYGFIYKQFKPYVKKNTNQYCGKKNMNLYIKFLSYVCYLYRKYNKSKKIFYLDEGIIHYLIALEVEFKIPYFNCLELFNALKKTYQIKCFYVNVDNDKCLYNFKNRNRKQTSIDFLDEKKIYLLLKNYNMTIQMHSLDYDIEIYT